MSIYTVFHKKHPLTFSSISPWKMFRFKQNFQGMLMMNQVFHQQKSKIFIATVDVILTSYLHTCTEPAIQLICQQRKLQTSSRPLHGPPNSLDLNLVDYKIWSTMQETVYRLYFNIIHKKLQTFYVMLYKRQIKNCKNQKYKHERIRQLIHLVCHISQINV